MTSHDPYCLTPWGDEEVSGRPGDRRATTQAGSRVPARLRQRAVVSPRTRQAGVGDARERPRLVRDLHQPAELAGDPSAASPEATVTRFVGRRAELREISARAAAAAAGTRQTVVIEGRPWIGKTALLIRALEQLPDYSQLQADCARGSAVAQLMSDASLASPAAHRTARGGLVTAVRAILEEAGPVAIALDNLHCIDVESAAELSVALSALRAAAVLVIVATRTPWRPEQVGGPAVTALQRQLLAGSEVSRIPLAELSVAETGQLLDRLGPAASERVAESLHRYTGGHPALLSVLLDQGLAGADTAPADMLGLFDPLVMSILRAVSSLPEASRNLLAAMTVSDEPWPLAVVGSVAGVEDPFEALEPLLDSGLVEWFPAETVAPVSIRYPLYRDVVYRSLPGARREALHGLAAGFALGTRAWAHRIAAASTAQPALAAMLEQEAHRYHVAGDSERAGTLLMWSATATSDPGERYRHLLQAAHWWLTLRAIDWGPRLESCLSDWPASAPRSMLMGLLAEASGRYAQARDLLAEAGDIARTDGSAVELGADIDLAMALVHADMGDANAEYRLAAGLLASDGPSAAHRAWAEYLAADACGRIGGPDAALAKLAELVPDALIDGEGGASADAAGQSVRLWARGSWRVRGGRWRDGSDDLTRMFRAGDRTAVDSVAPIAHAYLAFAQYLVGDWKAAEQASAQAVAALSGHAVARLRIPVHAVAACVDAAAGRSESAARHVQSAQRWLADCGPEDYAVFPAVAAATSAQARADYRRMAAALASVLAGPAKSASHHWWWQPLHVEALIGTGQLGAAQRALDRFIDFVGGYGRQSVTVTWLEAWLAAARHDELKARARFEEAIARPPARDDVALHRARLEHEYGRYLMSGRNRRAAIAQLRRAHEFYTTLGAGPFAERCASDLEACGVRVSSRSGGRADGGALPVLSPRERRVAHLAVQGLTNQEIAGELFISAKTVEYHLGNVFAKLGISSRRQLAARLGSGTE